MKTADEKLELMHLKYGKAEEGIKCKSCPHLDTYSNEAESRYWYKCHLYGVTNSNATDWRCGNQACGAIAIDPEEARERGLYGWVFRKTGRMRAKEPEEQIQGQIRMEI